MAGSSPPSSAPLTREPPRAGPPPKHDSDGDSENSSDDDASIHDVRRLIAEAQADSVAKMEDMRQSQMQYFDKVASALQNNINAKYDNLSREVGLVNARSNQSDSVVADHT